MDKGNNLRLKNRPKLHTKYKKEPCGLPNLPLHITKRKD